LPAQADAGDLSDTAAMAAVLGGAGGRNIAGRTTTIDGGLAMT
jgi:hypothetical protein